MVVKSMGVMEAVQFKVTHTHTHAGLKLKLNITRKTLSGFSHADVITPANRSHDCSSTQAGVYKFVCSETHLFSSKLRFFPQTIQSFLLNFGQLS